MTSINLPLAPALSLWRFARSAGLLLTVVLIAALLAWPTQTLHVLWDMVIPLLPAVFLLNPVIWRNVCPLATLNSWSGSRWGTRTMDRRSATIAGAIGIGLLLLMVPARRFVFNTNGLFMAATIVVVALLALGSGALFARRAAFCNGLCPVLPVEKLYGQHPLVPLGTARCGTCTVCTPSGCIELAGPKTMAQTLGPARKDVSWLFSPFGIFAAAFPGFIAGYFTTQNGTLASAGDVYAYVLSCSAASYIIVTSVVAAFSVPASVVAVLLGGVSVALYYWFSATTLATSYGGGVLATDIVRVVMLMLAGAWVLRALGRNSGPASATSGAPSTTRAR